MSQSMTNGKPRVRQHFVHAACQPLERRVLLSLAPAGPEFRVNTFTLNSQSGSATAMDGDGDFVVAWTSLNQDGSSTGVYAQRYNASGAPQGGEFRVNSTTSGSQGAVALAVDADGDFVVAWEGNGPGDTSGIFAQRYDAAGVPQGGEFRLNALTADQQRRATVAMDLAGNFVVAWSSGPIAGDQDDVYVRRFTADGVAQGNEVRVNVTTGGPQTGPAVAADAAGNFVVAWTDRSGLDGAGDGVFARRYNATGQPQAGEFRVNTHTTNSQSNPAVAMDADGDFVVAWTSAGQDHYFGGGIYAQRFNAAGAAQGGEFRVNTYTTGVQEGASVAMDADGDFLVTWQSFFQDGDGNGAFAQAFSAAGVPQGSEFRVNTFTTGAQRGPRVARDHAGNAVITWWSNNQDGSDYGVYAQRYAESTDAAGPVVAGVFVGGARVRPYSVHQPPVQQIVVSFSEDVTNATDPVNWLLTRDGADISGQISSVTYGFNATANRYEATVNLSAPQTGTNYNLVARDTLRDAAGNALDGNLDGAPGGSSALPFSVATFAPSGAEFRVNSQTSGWQRRPRMANDANGNFVVAWESSTGDGSFYGIYARRYNAEGVAQSDQFRVNTTTFNQQKEPAVAMDADGDFVVAWQGYGPGDIYGIFAQRFNAAGVAQGAEFRVNTFTTDLQWFASVAMDADGDFVIAWQSRGQDGGGGTFGDGIFAQRYNAAGVPQGAEFRVNTTTTDDQRNPTVAMDRAGNFVIAWDSRNEVFAQRYDTAGLPLGTEFRIQQIALGCANPHIAMDPVGNFVVTWERNFQDAVARRFTAAGVPASDEFSPVTMGTQGFNPAVSVTSNGDFAISWHTSAGAFVRQYSATGLARTQGFQVNTLTGSSFGASSVLLRDDSLIVAWEVNGPDGDGFGVYARRYVAQQTPSVGTLADTPDPIAAGNTLTLSASNVTDDGTVASVSFYRETNGVAGLQVGFQGDAHVGTASSSVGGVWSAEVPTAGLGGTYTYWAQATDDEDLIGSPASTTNTVIPGAPAVTNSNFNFATLPQRLSFTFDQNVGPSLGLDDIVVQQLPNGITVVPNALSYDAGTNTATFSFNTALPDGRYRARLIAAGISGPGGPMAADHLFDFTFLRGDANGDGRVNLNDFNILAANFGQSPRDFTQGDFDYSGNVNLSDFNILASRFGAVVVPAAGDAARGEAVDEELPDELDELLA